MKFAVVQWLWALPGIVAVCWVLFRWGNRRRRQSLDQVLSLVRPPPHAQISYFMTLF